MALKAVLLAVVTLLGSGCIGQAWYVDSRFTPAEEAQIQAAADSWMAGGGAPIDLVFGQHVTGLETNQRVIVRAHDRSAEVLWPKFSDPAYNGFEIEGWDETKIILDVDRIDADKFQRTIAHELGHAYGLCHSVDEQTLMFEVPGAPGPTSEDFRALEGQSR